MLGNISQIGGMATSHANLFDLAGKRLAWTASRQNVLASNIANANTPGYQARDVESFDKLLSRYGVLTPNRTQASHLAGTSQAGGVPSVKETPSSRSIDGNGVALEAQLMKIADTETMQSMVTTIWKKYAGMLSMALGRSS